MSPEKAERKTLTRFYNMAKNLFLLNSNVLLNDLLDEKFFQTIVGMLENDPSSPEPKKHRAFLFENSRFREVLPIKTEELKKKIQLTYQAQYVQVSLFSERLCIHFAYFRTFACPHLHFLKKIC